MTSSRAVLGFFAALSIAACFDSDETFAAVGTSSTGPATTTGVDPTTTSTSSTSTGEPDVTCQNAITCVFQCALEIQQMMMFEPELSCFLDCIEILTEEEAVKLIKLANCASDLCEAEMECQAGELTSTGSSSSGGETGTGSSSTGGESSSSSSTGAAPPIDPCVQCIFGKMLDEETPGCEEFAMECD